MEENIKKVKEMAAPLLAWYDEHKRDLPWRSDISAYRTWVSEIMLQQTRVSAVIPYFHRFLEAFPTVEALAAAEEDDLLKLWEGLGDYNRARNLHRAAKMVAEEFGGKFPETAADLRALPGVGDYTAGAIASIAFGEKVPAVDGNVLRVLTRYLDHHGDITEGKVKAELSVLAGEAVDEARPGDFNQAMMDLGATVCLPNGTPICDLCPLKPKCRALKRGTCDNLPIRKEKKERRYEDRTVLIAVQNGKVAVRRRPKTGLLASLWEFPSLDGTWAEWEMVIALSKWNLTVTDWLSRRYARHIFTHVEWEMTGYFLRVSGEGVEDFRWVDKEEFKKLAIPSAFAAYRAEALRLLEEEA